MRPRDPYSALARFYDAFTAPFLERIRRDVCRLAADGGAQLALDVCCGTGRQCILFRRLGLLAAGVDASPAMLAVARVKSPADVPYLRGDAADLPLSSSRFDAAVISLALHENGPFKQERMLLEARRVLRPGGMLFCLDYDPPAGAGGWLMRAGFVLAERSMGGEHYAGFRALAHSGGLSGLLARTGLSWLQCRRYFGGNLSLTLART
jgi:ubiquinone/menaquinone biosynthesis C-methylase UbiE